MILPFAHWTRQSQAACRLALLVLAFTLSAGHAAAGPITPTYSATFTDAVTIDNNFTSGGKRYYDIDAGADSYQNDFYERPVVQTFEVRGSRFAANEYQSNLDIASAQAGIDNTYLYIAIDLAGLSKHTEDGANTVEGLIYRYGFRLGTNATDPGSKGGHLIFTDTPTTNAGTNWTASKIEVWKDTNNDVGGTGISVTKQNLGSEVNGNGYDQKVASDGKVSGNERVFARISPTDSSVVEFAFQYDAFGYTRAQLENNLSYLVFEAIKGGPKDPANYLWNDEYTQSEAGSPYRATTGDTSKSEFGTQGLGNIYLLDTLQGGNFAPLAVPEPASVGLLGVGAACLAGGALRRRWRKPAA